MKSGVQIVWFCSVLFLLSGCRINEVYDPANIPLQGNLEIHQPGHISQLRMSIENLTQNYGGPRFGTDPYRANCFVFTIIAKEKGMSLNSADGSYQYNNGIIQKLNVAYLNSSNAVFFTSSNLVHTGSMDFGKYKLNIEYVLSGQSYSCQFDVNYVLKTKRQVTYFWELGKLVGP